MQRGSDRPDLSRRRYLASVASGTLAALAGCEGDAGDETPVPTTTTTRTEVTTTGTRVTTESTTVETSAVTSEGEDTTVALDGPEETWDEGGPPDRDGWQVTFQDDFRGDVLDWDTWEIGYGPASQAPCAGIECARKENVTVEDDRLVLTTTPEGAEEIPNDVWLAEYTTGAVSTASTFQQQFGYFEAKAKIPVQPGALPAFWAWTREGNPPEIDFYEVFGDRQALSVGVPVDCNGNGEFLGLGTSYEPDEPLDATFHVVGAAWTPEYVAWYVDGEEIHREDGFYYKECHTPEPMFPMLTTYVMDEESWAGDEVIGDHTNADYPYTHEFEWVRMWQRADWE